MALVATDSLVLHAFDYMETSRIVRLLTRDEGVQSVIAKGARRPRSRFGTALDLFAEGTAHFSMRPGRELHTLIAFDVSLSRPGLAEEVERFAAASAIAELALRFGRDDSHEALFEGVRATLEEIEEGSAQRAAELALGGAWRMVTELGFAPALNSCASCHAEIVARGSVAFSARAGGVLCDSCTRLAVDVRRLPSDALTALVAWQQGEHAAAGDSASTRAHQRLLREFLAEHLADDRVLTAFEMWERERLTA